MQNYDNWHICYTYGNLILMHDTFKTKCDILSNVLLFQLPYLGTMSGLHALPLIEPRVQLYHTKQDSVGTYSPFAPPWQSINTATQARAVLRHVAVWCFPCGIVELDTKLAIRLWNFGVGD